MDPYQPTGFPWGIHLIFIPLTFAIGFLLGWVIRGKAARKERYRQVYGDSSLQKPDH